MNSTLILDEKYSTTRIVAKEKPKIINKPEDKFKTVLFLPLGENRKGEGGLRTKGYFKHSYKLVDGVWYICDTDGNPAYSAPENIQNQINEYINKNKATFKDNSTITNLPLISVITVVLNGEKYLEETILSVINQTYPNVEYIIIDGGSTDSTMDIIKKYEDKIDYWISEKDKGIYDAMNKGIRTSTGYWLNFMNAGDSFCDEKVLSKIFTEKFFEIMDVDVVYGNTIVKYDDLNLEITSVAKEMSEIFYGMPFCHQSSFFRRKSKEYYNPIFAPSADYNMIFKFYIKGKVFYKISEYISKYRAYGDSDSNRYVVYKQYANIIKEHKNEITKVKYVSSYSYFLFLSVWSTFKFLAKRLLPSFFVRIYLGYKYNKNIFI